MDSDRRRSRETVIFLRMAAAQMRALAERTPQIATELHHMAHQLDTEANDLERDTR